MSSDFLNISNSRKLKEGLKSVLNQAAIDSIEAEIARNSNELYGLGLLHYRFAITLQRPQWRQRVSRLYYSSYAASAAVRLYVAGEYSTDVKGHKKVGELPGDFPERARFANQLPVLRVDRNTCDYSHDAHATDLVIPTSEATRLVADFLKQTRTFLETRGLTVRGQP